MLGSKDYIIEISKLTKEHNVFEFDVTKELFDKFNTDNDGNVSVFVENVTAKVKIDAIKNERIITFAFVFDGEILTQCSRCLAPLTIPLSKKTNLYIKIGMTDTKSGIEEVDVNEWLVDDNVNELDFANYIYEEIIVEIPIAPLHKKETDCDKTMLEKLSDINRRSENKDEIDPRWDKLKELIKE